MDQGAQALERTVVGRRGFAAEPVHPRRGQIREACDFGAQGSVQPATGAGKASGRAAVWIRRTPEGVPCPKEAEALGFFEDPEIER